MLRFILDVLLLRNLIESRLVRAALLIFFLGCLIAGAVYTFVFLNAAEQRSHSPYVHTHHTH